MLLCLLLTLCPPLLAQTLSPQAKVSLLTMGPGKELYSSFGHTAIWIEDPASGIDNVYNYGTFDFRTEGFYWKFIRGSLPYQLSVYPFRYTIAEAQADNRWLTEQVLNLSAAQKQRLFDLLETNARPENRQYFYKFFFDNCSTRPRDMLLKACGDSLKFFPFPKKFDVLNHSSFRSWMNGKLGEKPLERWAMNTAIGLPSDRSADYMEAMYLPQNLQTLLQNARLGGKPVVAQSRHLHVPEVPKVSVWRIVLPYALVFLLSGLVAFWLFRYHREGTPFWLDYLLLGVTGFMGLVLLFLWFGTDHGVTTWNPSLLIFSPLNLVAVWFLNRRPYFRTLALYFGIAGLVMVLVGVLTPFITKSIVLETALWCRFFQLGNYFFKASKAPQLVHEP